ncbi:MAG: LacI family DNA-binding transcriptional regulator [Clostridium sp.]|nr:LacI family DNA-binding transcriptional regulator [Clostridium sp.]
MKRRRSGVTINEIAKMAGVSRATVSRYLNDGYVSEEKKERIAGVIAETGYIPSSQAQMLRSKKTGLIGVIIPKISSDSIGRMVDGIGEELAKEGYQLLLASTNNNEREEVRYLQTFRNNYVDGVILIGTIFRKEHRKALEELEVPVVILGQQYEGYACVYQDDCHSARDVAELLTKSCRHIAYIGVTPKDKAVGAARKKGFQTALSSKGLEPVAEKQIAFRMEEGYQAMRQIVETIPYIDGVFCATDMIAAGALQYLREAGLERKVCVTGMGDSRIATILQPSLSTVHFHYKSSGREAARLLIEMLQKSEDVRKEIKMGYQIIERDSTRDI